MITSSTMKFKVTITRFKCIKNLLVHVIFHCTKHELVTFDANEMSQVIQMKKSWLGHKTPLLLPVAFHTSSACIWCPFHNEIHRHFYTNTISCHFRSTAFGVISGINRIAAILGNITFGELVDVHCAIPMLMVAALLTFGGLCSIKLPNTMKKDIH